MTRHVTRRECLRRAALGALAFAPPMVGPALAATNEAVQVLRPAVGALPPIPLLSMNGQALRLDTELATEVPLLLNFVFTTCSSSCSVQTAVLVQVQRALADQGRAVQLASITIDPDNDTPQQLHRFADQFGIKAGWQFYTGRFDDLLKVQKHFDVYRGSKASHPPVLFLRKAAAAPWVRLEGFPAASRVLAVINTLPARA